MIFATVCGVSFAYFSTLRTSRCPMRVASTRPSAPRPLSRARVEAVPKPATPTVDPRAIPEAFESPIAQRVRREFGAAHQLLEQLGEGVAAIANDPSLTDDHKRLMQYDLRLNLGAAPSPASSRWIVRGLRPATLASCS